jgi:glycosyltransferase involved in cell wall biosynthesis
MKIACFTTLSPIRSGISGYNEDLLPYLTKRLEIDLFIDDYEVPGELREQYSIYSYRHFAPRYASGEYDGIVYHMGNNPYHRFMYPILIRYPGITVLHDYVLHHFFAGMALTGGVEVYLQELRYNYGETGDILGNLYLHGIRTELEYFLFPMNRTIIDSSRAIVVHSDYLKKELETSYPGLNVRKINMGIPASPAVLRDKREIKEKFGIPSESFVIGTFGFTTPIKKIDLALEAFQETLREVPQAMLLVVGDIQDQRVGDIIQDFGLEERVRVTGYVPDEHFKDYIQATDLAINLRYPTAGETSASLLDVMAHGVPVIIFNYRQFAEIPDDCCLKIDLGDNEKDELTKVMVRVAGDDGLRENVGRRAREYVATNCSLEKAANDYYDFLVEVFAGTGGDVLSGYGIPRTVWSGHPRAQTCASILSTTRHLAETERGRVVSEIVRSITKEFADIGMTYDSAECGDFLRALQELGLSEK